VQLQCNITVIALFKKFDLFADLIPATILNSTCFFKVSNKHFNIITYIWQALGQITFCNYIVATISFFVITIHYVNIVLTPTVSPQPILGCQLGFHNFYHPTYFTLGPYHFTLLMATPFSTARRFLSRSH